MSQAYKAAVYSGMTPSQISDCYRAGRSPNTGRLLRTSPPSAAEKSAREMNWRKLLIKGAVGSLRHVAYTVGVNGTALSMLSEIEQLLLEASANKHEAIKRR